MARAYFTAYANEVILNSYRPTHLVTSHVVYAEFGLLARQASKFGCSIHLKDMSVYYKFNTYSEIYNHYLQVTSDEFTAALNSNKTIEKSIEYLNNRLTGSINELDVQNAFKNKNNYTLDEVGSALGVIIEKSNFNVVIFAHAFSDAPHVGSGLIFDDYYQWLLITLKEVSQHSKYNIFVKEHPGAYLYNESGAVRNMVKELGAANCYILPDNCNTASISLFSDVILTAQGTAAIEFTAMGIPCLTAGETYYSRHGIANSTKSIPEYIAALSNLNALRKPDDAEKLRAYIHLYLTFSRYVKSEVLPQTEILPGDYRAGIYEKCINEFYENIKLGHPVKDHFYCKILDNI
jgi:capsule polysaccharide export protein KpsC/LpsZ